MIRNPFNKENTPLNWDRPGRAVRVGWGRIPGLNQTLATMVGIAAHSEGISADHVAVVQISSFARSTTGRGDVRFARFGDGFASRGKSILSERFQFVSPRDVSRLAGDIMQATDEETRRAFRSAGTPRSAIVSQIFEDALATIAAGSVALQMGVAVDENQLTRKQRAILFEYRKRRAARG